MKYNILNKNTFTILNLVHKHCEDLNIFSIDIDLNGDINILGHFNSNFVASLIRRKFKCKVKDNGFVKLKRNILTITLT